MGATSTESLDELRAKYEALEDKRSAEGAALRAAIKDAEGAGKPAGGDDEGILPILSEPSQAERRAVYWLGVIPGNPETGEGVPPMHQIDGIGGGVAFYEWHTPHEGRGQDGTPRKGQYPGYLMELTESQVSQLRQGLRSSVIRWRVRQGLHRHGYIVRFPGAESIEELRQRFGLNDHEVARLKVRAQAFRFDESDEPVARYIYCVKVDGPEAKPGSSWRPSVTLPPSVEQRGKIEGP